MAEQPAAEIQLLRSQKATLIEILSGDADFVLQHADARSLLSLHGYQQVKACRIPSEKVTDLLDHIIQRGPEAAKGLLELLKEKDLQETFPRLDFIKHLQVNTSSSGTKAMKEKEKTRATKRKQAPELPEPLPSKQINGSHLVNEKQLMTVARAIGKCWREIGRSALDVSSVKLEQIEEDHSLHVERVFAMLRYWQTCQRKKATAAHLHSLLSQGEWALPSESIDFLLRTD
ncbi:CARD and Death domain-containing protein [Anabas testudineus]|uniref:CARD and Death domain-containing protein n=1 Tax=Anabas testudineus TaxID=64144 RepID=UPI000E456318|nr:CARD and Death domain-containing protein [Anabas testudineus]